jgi:PleD family two-component response regulator
MDRLIHIADLAMYEAKRSGNNQYRLGNISPIRAHSE